MFGEVHRRQDRPSFSINVLNRYPREGAMTRKREVSESNEIGMELKYCEHCGGLWVRERGAGTVYCERCEAQVAELPATRLSVPKKQPGRLILPVRPDVKVEDYGDENDGEDGYEFEA